ncbi:MAG: penicillin acylase family protein [Chloroflexi bacterium]|nr:penicillin acylase family protein [Chloroflexota bacterium]
MRLLKRILQIVLVVIVLILLVGGGAGYWFATKSHPQIDGTLQIKGLKDKVEIVRDTMGVPHIYATNADDLFFANGYVMAQDRLWQMEYNRRVGHGTLSDIFGAATITQDRFLRTMGLGRAARADYAVMSEELKHILCDGVRFERTLLGRFVPRAPARKIFRTTGQRFAPAVPNHGSVHRSAGGERIQIPNPKFKIPNNQLPIPNDQHRRTGF